MSLGFKERSEENSGDTSPVVRSVLLQRFRNYAELEINLDPGFTIVAGPNAQGKTNLLEALYLLSTTRLLRGQRDAEAIQEGQDSALVQGDLGPFDTTVAIRLERGLRKKATLNGMGLPRASDLLGRLPCVCVCVEDMEVVRGEPSVRRLFLDLELSGLYPAYLRHFATYKRSLEQRNTLLRLARDQFVAPASFEPWEQTLSEHGAAMRTIRDAYVRQLSETAQPRHAELGGGEALALTYDRKDEVANADEMATALAATRPQDIARGGTSIGPHRDDISIWVGGKEARLYGSQGQQRTAVLAMKFGSMEVSREVNGSPPLLLLDDILSDLDASRRSALTKMIVEHAAQAVLTCTEAVSAGPAILDRASVFEVRSGTVTRA